MRLRSGQSGPALGGTDPMVSREPRGAGRAADLFLTLARDGDAEAVSQRSVPRSLIAFSAAVLYLTAAPLYWANVAEGKVRHAPVATLVAKSASEDQQGDDNDDTPGPGPAPGPGATSASSAACPPGATTANTRRALPSAKCWARR